MKFIAIILTVLLTSCTTKELFVEGSSRTITQSTKPDAVTTDLNFPGCKGEDIFIGNRTWANCNIGSLYPYDNGSYLTWDQAKKACPVGYKLPSVEDWRVVREMNDQGEKKTEAYSFQSLRERLQLPLAGMKLGRAKFYEGPENKLDSGGSYWTSDQSSSLSDAVFVYFSENAGGTDATSIADGLSVRCVKD